MMDDQDTLANLEGVGRKGILEDQAPLVSRRQFQAQLADQGSQAFTARWAVPVSAAVQVKMVLKARSGPGEKEANVGRAEKWAPLERLVDLGTRGVAEIVANQGTLVRKVSQARRGSWDHVGYLGLQDHPPRMNHTGMHRSEKLMTECFSVQQ